MRILLIMAFLVCLTACGKNSSGEKICKSRQQKIVECLVVNRHHHPHYAERICYNSYPEEKCYR